MKIKIKIPNVCSSKFWLWIALVITIISETLIGAELIEDSTMTRVIQYFIILLPLGLNFLIMVIRSLEWHKKLLFTEELKVMSTLIIILGGLSLYRSMMAGRFAFNSIMELIQIILPFIFTFFVLNLLTFDEIASFMKFTLWCTIIGYIISTDFVSITSSDIIKILVFSTYSPFENSTFAEISSGLGAYFIYNRRKMPVSAILSVLLNFLMWKRVLVLMTIFLLLVSFRNEATDILKRRIVIIAAVAWFFIVLLLFYLYQPEVTNMIEDLYGINLKSLTLYRIYRLWYVYETDFVSYGLGSTSNYIKLYGSYLGSEFEMDFIRIMFEVGPIAIAAMCISYFKVIRCNKYAFVMINCCFLNLLMANGLLRYWGWTLRIITVAIVNYYNENKELIEPEPFNKVFRWGDKESGNNVRMNGDCIIRSQ